MLFRIPVAWDGLALVRRGGESFICEPHVGGGNPIASSEGTAYLNDMLGTTVCVREGRASSRPKPRGKCTAAALTAFGEPLPGAGGGSFFTGKPQVEGLGRVFLMRNYRPGLAKWQTADPLGYPDGWNQLAYGVNSPLEGVDLLGAEWKYISFGIRKVFGGDDATIPIAVAPNPNGVGQYDIIYPQNIKDAIDKYIENNEPLDPSVAEWLFRKWAPSYGVSLDIGDEIDAKMHGMGIFDYEVLSIELLRRDFNTEAQSIGVLFYEATFLWLVHVRYE